ncbi:CHAD domain-containing protein [Streptomyces sp. P17]|uniref:CHAD domain-containing protein n=1 Tax=Streptomyces sp. P17 TaxID=3074716 RepID=UPI0028F4292E|nr:CHAD domain-containing protein [Streptomyces sp. P17]MDT9698719.1 CHAD domain-containing protein [Streptomyces sp. P17]
MAQQHLDPTNPTAVPVTGEALETYLRTQAMEFLRALRLHRETGGGDGGSPGRAKSRAGENGSQEGVDAARALRRSARRISGSLHTFRPFLDPDWSERIRPELAWLSGTLAMEHAYAARLERLLLALHRLSGATVFPTQPGAPRDTGATASATPGRGSSTADASAAGRGAGTAEAAPGGRASAADGAASRGGAASGGGAGTTDAAAGSRAAGAAPVPLKAAPGNAGHPSHPTATTERGKLTADAPSTTGPAPHPPAPTERGNLTVGAAKAGALLERQLTLARTRAHSSALQALGSSRFHAVADNIAVLASEVPLTPTASTADLRPLAAAAEERLTDAVSALPLVTAGHPYNAEALIHGLSPDPAPHPQDAPWHQVRLLLRLHRYAREALLGEDAPLDVRLLTAGQALDRHRDASEAAAAAAAAARTPRIAPATAYALGVLHADQRHEVEAARFAFQQSWQTWQKQRISTP